MAYTLMVCIKPGKQAFRREGTGWRAFTPAKALCGRLKDFRLIKGGDVRNSVGAAVISVRGVEYASAHAKTKGRAY